MPIPVFKQELNRKNYKLNKFTMTNRTNAKEFSIIRFEPNNILLMHKPTKRPYQYLEPASSHQLKPEITHPALIRPIVYHNGLLYPKGISTLQNQIDNRKRAYSVIPFTEEEIINTLLPIFDCLIKLHQEGIIHGAVSPSNIVFTQEEEVKIRDWMFEVKDNPYYFSKQREEITCEDDLGAFGQILAHVSTLKKGKAVFSEKEINGILEAILDKYSKGFFFAIAVLLRKNKERFELLPHFFANEDKYLNDLELNSLYESLKREKEKKKQQVIITNENIVPPPLKGIASLGESPVKKIHLGASLNNTLKRNKDDENKKAHHEETKKKQIDKINKIIERSNQFVNELMARKNNEHILKKIAPKPNIATNLSIGYQSKRTVKQISLQSSPIKRIRTNSKRK